MKLHSLLCLAVAAGACGGSGSPAGPSTPPTTPGVGPGGGTVDGPTARLVVPANALATTVALTLRNTTAVPLDPYAAVGGGVEVGPAGTTFSTPATLALRYTTEQPPLGIDPRELRLHVLEGGEWRLVPGGAADPAAREVTAPITAAGTYGVRWVVGPGVLCNGPEARQFDFWLGSWDLTVGTRLDGVNEITRHGCVIEEDFQSAGGSRGRSVSFLGADRQWYQTYIDSTGARLPLRGRLEGGNMVLYHELGVGRASWLPLGRDRVRFIQESLSGGVGTITFDSVYVRR